MTTHRYSCKQQPVLHADGQEFPSLKSRTHNPLPNSSGEKKKKKKKRARRKKKKQNENKEDTLDWMHRRAPGAPALSVGLYSSVDLDLFRSQTMED